jgi:hypothetical protein
MVPIFQINISSSIEECCDLSPFWPNGCISVHQKPVFIIRPCRSDDSRCEIILESLAALPNSAAIHVPCNGFPVTSPMDLDEMGEIFVFLFRELPFPGGE